jgi:hypothetical protein
VTILAFHLATNTHPPTFGRRHSLNTLADLAANQGGRYGAAAPSLGRGSRLAVPATQVFAMPLAAADLLIEAYTLVAKIRQNVSANTSDRRPGQVIQYDDAPGPQKLVNEEQINKHVIEYVVAVYECKIDRHMLLS